MIAIACPISSRSCCQRNQLGEWTCEAILVSAGAEWSGSGALFSFATFFLGGTACGDMSQVMSGET